MPCQVEGEAAAGDAGLHQFILDGVELGQRAGHACLGADHADIVPHHILQLAAQRVDIALNLAALRPSGRVHGARHLGLDDRLVRVAKASLKRDIAPHHIAGHAAIDGRVGDTVAAQPVGAMRAASILAGDIESGKGGPRVGIDDNAAHEVMRRRHHLDQAARQVEAAIGAAFHHAGEFLRDIFGPQM